MRWNYRRWGRCTDLIHQSDIHTLVGKFGCPEAFRRKKQEAIDGGRHYENASGKLLAGRAVHAVLHRILRSPPAVEAVLNPTQRFARATLERAYDEEFHRDRAGREVDWYKTDPGKHRQECVSMLFGLLGDIRNHVAEVVAVEAGFVYQLDGIWLTGACDLIYRAEPGGPLCLADWKTGKQKPHRIELDHSWQAGIYAGAMRHGYFVPFEHVDCADGEEHRDALERACLDIAGALDSVMACDDAQRDEKVAALPLEFRSELDKHGAEADAELARVVHKHGALRFEEYPDRIRYVHLRDYIPYARKTKRRVEWPEDIAWSGLASSGEVTMQKGDLRGPAWYHVRRSESDTVRLTHLLKAVVAWVRFGRFPAAPGELCTRCRFKEPCLNDGYQPTGEDKRKLAVLTRGLGVDGFGELDSI